MKKLSKIILSVLLCSIFIFSASVKADDEKPLINVEGEYITYRNSSDKVYIPIEYKQQDTYLRSVWVTPLAGNISRFSSVEAYKEEVTQMFDVMEYYNLNSVIFHIRIFNDALYLSDLNPTSDYLNTTWDALTWVIDECHNRGFEFHAWLNPYRIKSSGGTTPAEEAAIIKSKQPNNIGSNSDNVLVSDGGWVMLNPGLPEVRSFLVQTVKEIMEKYKVDAIHFDDYFYVNGINDDSVYLEYNPTNLSKEDWRREQVNIFIRDLRKMMLAYNEENNCCIQLGISPTGIYRNGDGIVTYDNDGTAITNGSNTIGQEHYNGYLFCDTKKWVDEELIDYICPQSYWGFTHTVAGFADVISWWDKVVANKKVNLYSGMGIYMSESPGSNYSWGVDYEEAYKQILFCTGLENVNGTVFYNYNYLRNSYNGDRVSLYGKGLNKVKEEEFVNLSVLPEIRTYKQVKLDNVTDLKVEKENDKLKVSFTGVDNAKAYVIYKYKNKCMFDSTEIVKILWANDSKMIFLDETNGEEFNYGVKTLSITNTLSDGVVFDFIEYKVEFKDIDNKLIDTKYVKYGESLSDVVNVPSKDGRIIVGWSKDLSSIKSDLVVYPKYQDSEFVVTFYDINGEIIKQDKLSYLDTANNPIMDIEGYNFLKFDKDFTSVKYDLDVYPIYEKKSYTVTFIDYDDTILSTQSVRYEENAYLPAIPYHEGLVFKGWDNDYNCIKSEIVIKAIFKPKTFTVTFVNSLDDSIIDVKEVPQYEGTTYPQVPDVFGYEFSYWRGGSIDRIICDLTIEAIYFEKSFMVIFYDYDGNVYKQEEVFLGDEYSIPTGPIKNGYKFLGWDQELSIVKGDLEVHPLFELEEIKEYTVTYLDYSNNIIGEEIVVNGSTASFKFNPPAVDGHTFIGWDQDGKNINSDTTIKALYSINVYVVTYLDKDNNTIGTENVIYNQNATFNIATPSVDGYTFSRWDIEGTNIKSDITIKALYTINTYEVTYVLSYGDKEDMIIGTEKVEYNQNPTLNIEIPKIKNYEFVKFDYDNQLIKSDIVIKLIYEEKSGCTMFSFLQVLFSISVMLVLLRKKKSN